MPTTTLPASPPGSTTRTSPAVLDAARTGRAASRPARLKGHVTHGAVADRVITSPVGDLLLESDGVALTAVRFLAAGGIGSTATGSSARTWPERDRASDPARHAAGQVLLDSAAGQLDEYFAGLRSAFDLPVRATGTPFQLAVWSALTRIPHGATWTYRQLATELGRPSATRAVGAACGRNPIPVVVPCHRVVGSDGTLTGYAGGTAIKAALLALETGTELDTRTPARGIPATGPGAARLA